MAGGLTIREVARLTGVPSGTLRMWETRYAFPGAERLPSGHRRYSEEDVRRVRQVTRDRDAGLSMRAAVQRARGSTERERSVFAAIRRRCPQLDAYVLPKATLIGLSHAIEDECCARAERPVLFASFQRERFYRAAEARWRELARTAVACVVFADFPQRSKPGGGRPVELPIDADAPFAREWSVVCDAPDYAVFMAGWERPGQEQLADRDRRFETVWSVEPELVREAARVCQALAAPALPELAETIAARLDDTPPPSGEELTRVGALTNRMVAYIGGGDASLVGPSR